jgi:hypothetical protein
MKILCEAKDDDQIQIRYKGEVLGDLPLYLMQLRKDGSYPKSVTALEAL